MTPALARDPLQNAIAALPANGLAAVRHAALEHLLEHGMPTTRHEDWKYTDLSSVLEISNEWLSTRKTAAAAGLSASDPVALTGIDDVIWLSINNGVVDLDSVQAARKSGVDVTLLSESDARLEFDAPLADLNTALLRDGLYIRVDAAASLPRPVGLFVFDDATSTIGVSQARVEVDVGENGSVDLIEYQASSGSADHYANTVVSMRLAAAASANYVRIQNRAAGHRQTGRLATTLQRDSLFRHAAFDVGGALIRNDLHIDISGAGAAADFVGVYLAGDGQHIDNHTRVDHRVGPARSKQEYRGIAGGDGRCVWNGKAIVHQGADGTDAQQANHNLLLSEKAEIDAKPELVIYADDVKCSHGTTIGQLDNDALYYLQTRGIDRQHAQRLLTLAFARAIVSLTPIEALQKPLGDLLTARLDTLVGAIEL